MHYYFPASGDIPAAGAQYSSSLVQFSSRLEILKFQQAGWWLNSSRQVCTVYSGTAWYSVRQQGGKTAPLSQLEKTGFYLNICINKEAQVKML